MKFHFFDAYLRERQNLTPREIDSMLAAGRAYRLGPTLQQGGVAVFPHTYLTVCSSQIAAAVHGALDSGADSVLAIGVLHSLSRELIEARDKEKRGIDLSDCSLRGIHGPRLGRGAYWKSEYSLLSFAFLLQEEVKRRGIKAPKLRLRYPYLVNRDPASLPGIKELEAFAKDSCLVATADFCHHGVAYGEKLEEVHTGREGIRYAKKCIEEHLELLCRGNYDAYYRHCYQIRSDAPDVGTLIYHLRSPKKAKLLDLKLADVSGLYEGMPAPSWVAASLVSLEV